MEPDRLVKILEQIDIPNSADELNKTWLVYNLSIQLKNSPQGELQWQKRKSVFLWQNQD